MEYVRKAPEPLPGLTPEETEELARIDVEGMCFGYHSLSAEKRQRLLELQMKMVAKENDASRSAGEPV